MTSTGFLTRRRNREPSGHDRRTVSRFPADDSDVVVVIGSGAGGGTLANELCQRGANVVLLEAGPHHQPEDFVNDEWAAFNQLAWLDERTTSGSWRIADDFPNLPAWTCKTVGGTTVHWAGCCPRFKEYEFRIRLRRTGPSTAPTCSTGRSAWPTSSPTTTRPRTGSASRRTNGIPPLPANNNYKVFANGAKRVGYKASHGPDGATRCRATVGRRRSRTASTSRATSSAEWSTLAAEIPKAERPASSTCGPSRW